MHGMISESWIVCICFRSVSRVLFLQSKTGTHCADFEQFRQSDWIPLWIACTTSSLPILSLVMKFQFFDRNETVIQYQFYTIIMYKMVRCLHIVYFLCDCVYIDSFNVYVIEREFSISLFISIYIVIDCWLSHKVLHRFGFSSFCFFFVISNCQ